MKCLAYLQKMSTLFEEMCANQVRTVHGFSHVWIYIHETFVEYKTGVSGVCVLPMSAGTNVGDHCCLLFFFFSFWDSYFFPERGQQGFWNFTYASQLSKA